MSEAQWLQVNVSGGHKTPQKWRRIFCRSSAEVPPNSHMLPSRTEPNIRPNASAELRRSPNFGPSLMWTYPTSFWRPRLGVMSLEFRQDFWRRKTRIHGLSYAVLSVILGFAVFVQLRLVTDGWTDRHTMTASRGNNTRTCRLVRLTIVTLSQCIRTSWNWCIGAMSTS